MATEISLEQKVGLVAHALNYLQTIVAACADEVLPDGEVRTEVLNGLDELEELMTNILELLPPQSRPPPQ